MRKLGFIPFILACTITAAGPRTIPHAVRFLVPAGGRQRDRQLSRAFSAPS